MVAQPPTPRLNLWQRFREFMGWHAPSETTFDTETTMFAVRCKYCGRRILPDPRGGWSTPEELKGRK